MAWRESSSAAAIDVMFAGGIDADSVVVGVLEGRRHEMFGHIADVATDGSGTLYILDSQYSEVRAFDQDGNFLGSFGHSGAGPGEFRTPHEIAVSGLTVFVIELHQIHVFQHQESGILFKESFTRDFMSFSGNCAMNGHLYTAGYKPEAEHLVHRFTADGVRKESFVEVYSSTNTTVQATMSLESLLACSEKHRIVGVVRDNIPVLAAYTENGIMLWRVRLTDFKPRVIEEDMHRKSGRAMVRQGLAGVGEGHLHTLFSDGADHFYLGYYTESDDEQHFANHIFRIDVLTGQGEHLGTGRLAAVSGGYVIASSHRPFPRVIISKHKATE